MKKIAITLIFSLFLTNCEQPSSKAVTTVTNQDQKSMAISKLMKGYVDNNFDGTIISEDCIVRFNNIELGKEDFVGLAPLHHSICLLYTSDAADDPTLCRSRWSPYH